VKIRQEQNQAGKIGKESKKAHIEEGISVEVQMMCLANN